MYAKHVMSSACLVVSVILKYVLLCLNVIMMYNFIIILMWLLQVLYWITHEKKADVLSSTKHKPHYDATEWKGVIYC